MAINTTKSEQPILRRSTGFRPMTRIRNNWKLILGVLVVLVVIVVLVRRPAHEQPAGGRPGAGAPMAVNVAKVDKGDVQVVLNALGTVTPLQTVTVLTQISGILQQIGFQEGQMVKAGDFLAQVDPRPYQAALEQARGTLAKDQALLKDAQLDEERYRKLVAEDSIASQQYDTQAALVRQYQGQVIADQAAVDSATINLNYCHIVSPVTGRVGLRQVDQGNYITPSSTTNGIVVITQLQPISVIFTLPEDSVIQVTQPIHDGQKLVATAYDRSNTTKLATGELSTYDNQIDTTTGMFKLRAQFDNPDMRLFPNQFVNIQLLVNTLHDQTIVPSAAIQRGAPGTFVYVVNPDSTVSVKPVKLGVTQGERQAILSGIEPGETVVTDGVDRLRDGAKVILPGAQPAPAGGPPNGARRRRDGAAGGQPPAGGSQ
jgi:multidrug efflux system membrane fusion protein